MMASGRPSHHRYGWSHAAPSSTERADVRRFKEYGYSVAVDKVAKKHGRQNSFSIMAWRGKVRPHTID